MKMAKFSLPDPDDRSKNDPSIIMSNKRVLGVYNQNHPDDDDMQKVTQKVQDYIATTAKEKGWDSVSFSGGQCILENKSFG